jgi:hypothetical protein
MCFQLGAFAAAAWSFFMVGIGVEGSGRACLKGFEDFVERVVIRDTWLGTSFWSARGAGEESLHVRRGKVTPQPGKLASPPERIRYYYYKEAQSDEHLTLYTLGTVASMSIDVGRTVGSVSVKSCIKALEP